MTKERNPTSEPRGLAVELLRSNRGLGDREFCRTARITRPVLNRIRERKSITLRSALRITHTFPGEITLEDIAKDCCPEEF